MKLCDAICVGAKMRPQAYGYLDDGKGTCALGAAMNGIGCSEPHTLHPFTIERMWPILNESAIHPKTGNSMTIRRIIVSLNDRYRWPREHIANWLETIERRDDPPVVKEEEEQELALV